MLDFANLGILLGFSPTGVRQIRFFCLSDTPFGNIARGSSPSKAHYGIGIDIAVRINSIPQKILLCLSETDSPSLFGTFKNSVAVYTIHEYYAYHCSQSRESPVAFKALLFYMTMRKRFAIMYFDYFQSYIIFWVSWTICMEVVCDIPQ